MADQKAPAPEGGKHEPKDYEFFVDREKYSSPTSPVTGSQLKAMIPNFQGGYQLVLEGHGDDPDKVIGDQDSVQLDGPKKHFYTVPPAVFGA